MIELSADQITAAVNSDRSAVRDVLAAMAPTINHHAKDAATVDGSTDHTMVSDYAQEASLAVMLSLPNFDGNTPGALVKYLTRYIIDAIAKARRVEAAKGGNYDVSDHATRTYERALAKAQGNSEKATELAQSTEEFGEKYALSADTAHRAAMARLPIASLNETNEDGVSVVEAHILPSAKTSMTPARRENIRRVRAVVAGLTDKQSSIVRLAVGMEGEREFGITFKRGKKVNTWALVDSAGMADELGVTANYVTTAWKQSQAAFGKAWEKAYGLFTYESTTVYHPSAGRLSEEEQAVLADVECSEEAVRLSFDVKTNSVEVIAVNDEGDAVTTWLNIPRAVALGIIAGGAA